MVEALRWNEDSLILIDQRELPLVEKYFSVKTIQDCYDAIEKMVVRGAPLIGFTALWGMVLWAKDNPTGNFEQFLEQAEYLKQSRPTAVNLEFELNRSITKAEAFTQLHGNLVGFDSELERFAKSEMDQIYSDNLSMAKMALDDLDKIVNKPTYRLMTLCNTGMLACGPMGTALGVISYAFSKGRVEHVYASETRPYLQGARLTAFELQQQDIPFEISVEGACSYLMKQGLVDAIFVGADRIAANGDSANKIGTSTLAIVAKHYGIPFYVVAPTSSFDLNANSGDDIPIEMRSEDEILSFRNQRVAPLGARAINPSFDITEHMFIEGIICEKGIIKYPMSTNMVEKLKGSCYAK